MFTLLITLIVIASVLLVLVVLAQNSKGGGLSSQFGGSGTSQVMGVKRTGDILEKITWGLAIAILVLSLGTKVTLTGRATTPGIASPNIERAEQQSVMPSLNTEIPFESTDSTSNTNDTGLEGLTEEGQ
jgi:preprotein translocase subunit SecG